LQRNATVVTAIVMVCAALSAVQPGCARRPSSAPALEAVSDQLPSWNHVAAKQAIVGFVDRVIDPASPDFVPEAERIAVFDNDGTLWAEQPAYFQLFFAIDRVKALAPRAPRVGDAAALPGGARR
jgi:hypothetical protein